MHRTSLSGFSNDSLHPQPHEIISSPHIRGLGEVEFKTETSSGNSAIALLWHCYGTAAGTDLGLELDHAYSRSIKLQLISAFKASNGILYMIPEEAPKHGFSYY